MLTAVLFVTMYSPIATWPDLGRWLDDAIEGNGTTLLSLVEANVQLDRSVSAMTAYAFQAVVCSDTEPFPSDPTDPMKEILAGIEEDALTAEIAPHFVTALKTTCQHWRAKPAERFTGPFNSTLANPILVIGNTADVSNQMRR